MMLTPIAYITIFFLSQSVLYSAQETKQSPDCAPFMCGSLGKVGFPFSDSNNPGCGLCVLNCTAPTPKVQFHEQGNWYNVEALNYRVQTMRIHDQDVQSNLEANRCDLLTSFSDQVSPFLFLLVEETHKFYKCKREVSPSPMSSPGFFSEFHNYTNCKGYDLYFYENQNRTLPSLPETLYDRCTTVSLPSAKVPGFRAELPVKKNLTLLWDADFTISWSVLSVCLDCHSNGGQCLSSRSGVTFECSYLKKGAKGGVSSVLIIALSVFGAGITLAILTLIILLRKNAEMLKLPWKKKKTKTFINFEAFLKNHGSLAPKRYRFKEVKIITNSFKSKLGQGGYGSVFKGSLQDGSLVAVKVLNEIKGNGEEFINEVSSISRTSHVNIVSLLGYCFEGSKRALIYEFMPNGSLEKFIYDEKRSDSNLGWETYYQVSVGIARGLEYLHRGCSTRILHFDIKPHNILLDQDFCPKITDFGLAKLCPRKESIISMLGTRGTVGYIAPEVFSRNLGGVSYKSDVYSYGMMILEMIGGRKNMNVGVDHSSEIYFPIWIYKRLELDEELGVHGVVSEEERELTRKMILVGLWCIQTNPANRPSMSRVLEMLEGSVEDLVVPPKPYLFSPIRVP